MYIDDLHRRLLRPLFTDTGMMRCRSVCVLCASAKAREEAFHSALGIADNRLWRWRAFLAGGHVGIPFSIPSGWKALEHRFCCEGNQPMTL